MMDGVGACPYPNTGVIHDRKPPLTSPDRCSKLLFMQVESQQFHYQPRLRRLRRTAASGSRRRDPTRLRQPAGDCKGNDPEANGYDRIRATRVLYDRGFGKVTRNQPRTPTPESERDSESAESGNQTNHSSDIAASNRPVAMLEEKLDDTLSPPQTPIRLHEPGHVPDTPGSPPDLARAAQYYVLEITNYGAELRLHPRIHTRTRSRRHLHQAGATASPRAR